MVALASALLWLAACGGERASLVVGMESTAVNSLIYLAQDQGYFEENGLNVVVKDYPSGRSAVDGLLAGEVDVATAAEFVLVTHALLGTDISTFGSIDEFLHIYLVAARNRGVEEPPDLRGKRIGLPLGTAAEFSLGRYLELHGMANDEVHLVDTPPAGLADALEAGELDAVVTWRPFVNAIEDRLGDGVVRWQVQNQQAAYCLAIAGSQWLGENPHLVGRFLRSLLLAEEYRAANPHDARASMQITLGYSEAYMDTVWPEHHLVVSLDQSLVAAMQDEARWLMSKGLTQAEETPDFWQFIRAEELSVLRPDAVDLIR